jgi:hydroxyacylglutathione hydrolase
MDIDVIVVGRLEVNCYIVTEDTGPDALIIDPGDEYEKIREVIETRKAVPKYILFTHAHYDHVCAAGDIKAEFNKASLVMHQDEGGTYQATTDLCVSWGFDKEDFPPADLLVKDGDTIELGSASFQVIHTPGHSPGGICLYGDGTLFTGDTLFADSVGRTDLPGASSEQQRKSLRKIIALPDDTVIRSGHGPEITLGRAKETNPFLRVI